jgi:hypothetical protein
MWSNFKAMPLLMKWVTAHALLCFGLLISSLVPHDSFSIDGHHVSYSEWWSSGAGPFASLLGVIMPFAAYLLLVRARCARITYLAALSIGLILPYIYWRQFGLASFGMFVIGLIGWYLYGKKTVQKYFSSNPTV